MEQEIAKKANSNNVATRKQALQALTSMEKWYDKKELVNLFLQDPNIEIKNLIIDQVLRTCHEKYISSLKLVIRSDDEKLRSKVLSVLSNSEEFNDIGLLLERLPHESQMIQAVLRQGILRIIKTKPEDALKSCVEALASNNPIVRSESFKIIDVFEDRKAYVIALYKYLKSANASVKELIYESVTPKKEEIIKLSKEIFNENKDMQIINLLSYLKDPALEDLLLEQIESEDWSLKLNSIQMLANMKSEKAKPKLLELLSGSENSLEIISALRLYKDSEAGVAFLRRLGKSNEKEQIELLKGIDVVSSKDKRYIEPLLVYALHDVSKLEAKQYALEIVKKICKELKIETPQRFSELEVKIKEVVTKDIPDLGLKIVE